VTPVEAFRFLEFAANRIDEGPQTGLGVIDAIKALHGKVARWRLLCLWEHLQTRPDQYPGAVLGASQNSNAALNGIATDLKLHRLGPVELAEAADRAKAG
jgi:hypothetical protein